MNANTVRPGDAARPGARPAARRFVLGALVIGAALAPAPRGFAAEPVPLVHAHAHNDYEHPHPLFDALRQGFCSVEADIFLVNGRLLVGHTRSALRPERTLEALYLDPLKDRVEKNGGRVYRNGPTFTLFIDVKSSAATTYDALRATLARYGNLISSTADGDVRPRAVDVVVSGNRATTQIAADKHRLVGIDGRLSDLDSDEPAALLPVISDNWRLHFTWRGDGAIPGDQREKLRSIVAKAHAHSRRVRFWATPEKPALWRELTSAGVDLINTDDLPGLAKYLRESAENSPARP